METKMKKTYRVIDYHTNYEFTGWMGRKYTDVDIARFWAMQKSEELHATVALYDGDRILNIYVKGNPVKLSDMVAPEFTLTLTRHCKGE